MPRDERDRWSPTRALARGIVGIARLACMIGGKRAGIAGRGWRVRVSMPGSNRTRARLARKINVPIGLVRPPPRLDNSPYIFTTRSLIVRIAVAAHSCEAIDSHRVPGLCGRRRVFGVARGDKQRNENVLQAIFRAGSKPGVVEIQPPSPGTALQWLLRCN